VSKNISTGAVVSVFLSFCHFSHAPLQQYQVRGPMEWVSVDILGPFPTTDNGNRYVLVAIDYFTKWPEAYAVPHQRAALGRNFEAQVFTEVCQRMGVRKTRITPSTPRMTDVWSGSVGRSQPNWLSSPHDISATGTVTYPWLCGRTGQQCKKVAYWVKVQHRFSRLASFRLS